MYIHIPSSYNQNTSQLILFSKIQEFEARARAIYRY